MHPDFMSALELLTALDGGEDPNGVYEDVSDLYEKWEEKHPAPHKAISRAMGAE